MRKSEVIANNERKLIRENIEEVRKWYENDLQNFTEICERLNVKIHNLKEIMIENNFRFRTHSENQKITMNRPDVKINVSIASKKSQPKRKATNLKKYGSEVPADGINWKDDYEKENGVRHPNQKQEFRDRMTGDKNPAKRPESRAKIKQNRWDNKTQEELDTIFDKSIDTWVKNLGVENPLESSIVIDKIRKTNLETRDVDWVTKDPIVKQKMQETRLENSIPIIKDKLNLLNLELVNEFTNVTSNVLIKCKICNEIFETVLDYVFHNYGLCPICFPKQSSIPEKEVKDFITSIIPKESKIEFNNRKLLNGKEIDILIIDDKIGIEFDGLYYHSEKQGVDENYHIDKTEKCINNEIQLIHIFEDEWFFNKEIVKKRLKKILSIDEATRIHARKCEIKEIDSKTKDEFLTKFHIQGKDISLIRLGAFYNDELVSVMTFSKGNISKGSKFEEGIWELNRFCSNYDYNIPGIASKLLTYFKRSYNWKEIFSYCDRRWSNGNTYYKIGFELDKITKPNYWYVKGMKRIHRFNLRKREDEPKDVPEWILRSNEGYYRIWDCGNLKFKMINSLVTN